MNYILMTFCAFLISMSIIFILVEIRAKFDRSFLICGVVNLLICVFCIVDIVIQPYNQVLNWTLLQHIIASFFPPFSFWLVMLILKSVNWNILKFAFLTSFVFTILFLSGIMLKASGKEIVSTVLYDLTFVPYIVFTQLYLFRKLGKNIKNVTSNQKSIIYSYLIGMTLLASGSLVDLFSIIFGLQSLFPSYSILGVIGFSAAVTTVFTEKLTSIIREREITFNKLREAYKDLEEVQSLKELGQSTAIINHEIRNYAAAISGYSEILSMSADVDEHSKKIVNRITECITRLTNFSNDILEFSKSKILKDKRPMDLSDIISHCIDVHFIKSKNIFSTDIEENGYNTVVNGDRTKLEQVFINIFKNAIEAKAQNIKISLIANETVLICTVDDDGIGCTQEQVGQIFKSFYTTKKNEGGTGLGMCVVRSVIEVHGGHVSAYSKNTLGRGEHGLSIHITFPRYEINEIDAQKKHDIILIKEDIQNLAFLIKIFQNVLINPYIVQNVMEIDQKLIDKPNMTILASPGQLANLRLKYKIDIKAYAIVEGSNHLPFVINEVCEEMPGIFNEEYLLKNIMNVD